MAGPKVPKIDSKIPKFEDTVPTWDHTVDASDKEALIKHIHSDPMTDFGAGMIGAEDGATLGFAPRMGAALGAGLENTSDTIREIGHLGDSPESYLETEAQNHPFDPNIKPLGPSSLENLYNEYLQANNARHKQARDEHPISNFVGNLTGGLALPIGSATKLGKAANIKRFLPGGEVVADTVAAPLLDRMADSAITGTGIGAVYGLSQSPDLTNVSQELNNIGSGAALGGVIGAAAPPVIGGVKAVASATGEGLAKIFGHAGKAWTAGLERGKLNKPNLATEAGREAETELRGEFANNVGNDLTNKVKELSTLYHQILEDAAARGIKVPQEKIQAFVDKQLAENPQTNLDNVMTEMAKYHEIINTAKDGAEVERYTTRFFGDGPTQIGKFKQQFGAKAAKDAAEVGEVAPPTEKDDFQKLFEQKQLEQKALHGDDSNPLSLEYHPMDDGAELGIIKQRTAGTDPAQGYKKAGASRVVDANMEGEVDPKQMESLNQLLAQKQAEQTLLPGSADPTELELAFEPTDIPITNKNGEVVGQKQIAIIRQKQLDPGMEGGTKRIASRVLNPPATQEPLEYIIKPSSEPGKVLGIIRRPIKNAQGQITSYEVQGTPKLLNAEDAAKFKEQREIVREGGRDLGDLEEMLQLHNDLRQKGKYSDQGGFSSDEAKNAAANGAKQVKQILGETVPELGGIDSKIAALKNVTDRLGIDTYEFSYDPKAQEQVKKRISMLINDVNRPDDKGDDARRTLSYVASELKKFDPAYAEQLEQKLNEFGVGKEIDKKVSSPFNALSTFGGFRGLLPQMTHGAGHKIGQTISENAPRVEKTVGVTVDTIKALTPQVLQDLGKKAVMSGPVQGTGQAMQDLSRILLNAAGHDERTRNALLFGVLQNSGYREWIMKNYMGNSVEVPQNNSVEIPGGVK